MQKLKEEKAKQKELEREAVVKPGNPILEYLSRAYNLVFYGSLGSGKTMMANLTTKYIVDKQSRIDYDNRRMYRYINPGYIRDLEKLEYDEKLNIHSEVTLEDEWGFTSRDLWDYLTQKKKTIENSVYFVDEIGTKLGKDQYYKQLSEKDPDYINAEDTARYARQDTNSRFIATEQDRDNIWRPIREKGFIGVEMCGVRSWIIGKGKVVRFIKNYLLKIMPGIFTINVSEVLALEFGLKNKVIAFLKMLLPAYFLIPKQYYIKKIKISKDIAYDYTQFKIHFILNGEKKFLIFTNEDIYKYNTRGHRDKYNAKFDEYGNRKFVKEQ